jgi:hypothetical protein
MKTIFESNMDVERGLFNSSEIPVDAIDLTGLTKDVLEYDEEGSGKDFSAYIVNDWLEGTGIPEKYIVRDIVVGVSGESEGDIYLIMDEWDEESESSLDKRIIVGNRYNKKGKDIDTGGALDFTRDMLIPDWLKYDAKKRARLFESGLEQEEG